MISFLEFLEERVNFASAKDSDYPALTDTGILVFSEEAYKKYKVEGKTHGLNSHAIKHLIEFDPAYVNQIISSCRSFLLDLLEKDKELEIRYYKSPTQMSKNKPKKIVSSASNGAFMNMFDLINDMKLSKQKLNPIESKMLKYINQFGQRYESIIERKLKNVTDLDSLSFEEIEKRLSEKRGVVSFGVLDRNVSKTIYVDLGDDTMIITTPDFVRSMFRMDNEAKRYVPVKFRSARFDNYNVLKAFRGK